MEIYNTLTRKKEPFVPRKPGEVTIYVCGPTTYNYIHLGNARPMVFFDTVRRYFLYKGYRVTYVQNFTDIDDKIIKRAQEEKEDPLRLSARYIEEYFRDADALNVMRADFHPRVTEHIPEIITLIEQLMARGAAYEVEGDVYFRITSFPEYGKLSQRSLEEMQAGARVEVDPRKQHPMDFALWKRAKPGEPAWDSPWGPGRPGWHIECSAMSLKYLGPGFDIHGGGSDLIFPHHENEIAQSEAATGQTFVRYWMHNGFITVNEEKMSKSLGNFFLVREVLTKFDPSVVRFFLLSTHYRSPLDFDNEKMAAGGRALERIKNAVQLLYQALEGDTTSQRRPGDENAAELLRVRRRQFEEAMEDDFNTALAIGVWFELIRDVNSYLQQVPPNVEVLNEAAKLYYDINSVLAVFPVAGEKIITSTSAATGDSELVTRLLDLLIAIRGEARARRDFALADRIRDELKTMGIVLEDTPQGTRWKMV